MVSLLEVLEKLKIVLSRILSEDEVQSLLSELTIASGKGAVAIAGNATEAVIITGSQNIVGHNNRIVINQGTEPEELVRTLRNLLREMQQANSTPTLSPEELRTATLVFLQDVETKFKETRLFHTKQPIILKDQYVPIQVTLEPHKRDVETVRGYWETEGELKRAYALKGGEEEAEKELKRQQVDWQEAKQKHQRIMVLADPGMGKSTLLRMEAGTTAQQELQKLENNQTTIDQTTLPMFLRLSELAKRSEELIEAISLLIQRDYPDTTPRLLPHLIQKLKTGKCLLLLDALDEVPKVDRSRIELQEKLDRFMQNYPCPVICTSRIVGYSGTFLAGGQEVEIVPFGEQQIEQYVTTWFTNAAEHISDEWVSAAELMRELHSKPQIEGLAQNPLLLSLICRLYQSKGLTLPTKRSQVYEESIKYMLSKWIIDNQRRSINEAWVVVKQGLLTELAYQFSCNNQEIFSIGELVERVDHYRRGSNAPFDIQNHNLKTIDLINELTEEDGIIQKLDRKGDRYIFLHRTFQEYLTACYLARTKEGLELAKAHFWEYDWHETISLMAGLIKNPELLIVAILNTPDDIFWSMLLLAGQCAAECENNHNYIHKEVINRIFQIWIKYDYYFVNSVVLTLVKKSTLALEKLHSIFLNSNHLCDLYIKSKAATLLGKSRDKQSETLLINALWDQRLQNLDRRWEVRIRIIESLGNIASIGTLSTLVALQRKIDEEYEHWQLPYGVLDYLRIALGRFMSFSTVPLLLIALDSVDNDVKHFATLAFEHILNDRSLFIEGAFSEFTNSLQYPLDKNKIEEIIQRNYHPSYSYSLQPKRNTDVDKIFSSRALGILLGRSMNTAVEVTSEDKAEVEAMLINSLSSHNIGERLMAVYALDELEFKERVAERISVIFESLRFSKIEFISNGYSVEVHTERALEILDKHVSLDRNMSLDLLEKLIRDSKINTYEYHLFIFLRKLAFRLDETRQETQLLPIYPRIMRRFKINFYYTHLFVPYLGKLYSASRYFL